MYTKTLTGEQWSSSMLGEYQFGCKNYGKDIIVVGSDEKIERIISAIDWSSEWMFALDGDDVEATEGEFRDVEVFTVEEWENEKHVIQS